MLEHIVRIWKQCSLNALDEPSIRNSAGRNQIWELGRLPDHMTGHWIAELKLNEIPPSPRASSLPGIQNAVRVIDDIREALVSTSVAAFSLAHDREEPRGFQLLPPAPSGVATHARFCGDFADGLQWEGEPQIVNGPRPRFLDLAMPIGLDPVSSSSPHSHASKSTKWQSSGGASDNVCYNSYGERQQFLAHLRDTWRNLVMAAQDRFQRTLNPKVQGSNP
jgi:hypothetical protein